jgi:predicted  nucleic acid-binding Zn-ribbon protein
MNNHKKKKCLKCGKKYRTVSNTQKYCIQCGADIYFDMLEKINASKRVKVKCFEIGCDAVLDKTNRKYCKKHRERKYVDRRANSKKKTDVKRYARYLETRRRWATKYRKENRAHYRSRMNASNARLKLRVMCHYGKNRKAVCCWRGCFVSDLDMLSIDHVKDDGKQHRASGYKGGIGGYRQLEQSGYPDGFQTLCFNHQAKKEIYRRRGKTS